LEGSSGDDVLPHVPLKASQKSGLSREDNNSSSKDPPCQVTNTFSTILVVEVPHLHHAAAPVDPFSPTSPPSNSFEPPSSPLPGPSDPFDSTEKGTAVQGAEDQDLEEEENCGDASDVIHHGGWFLINQIKWAHAKCEEFFAKLDAKAKEWNRSPESVWCITLAISPSKMLQNGNVWNAFQALYKKDHLNTDPSGTSFIQYIFLH
jgi:hypothetical protein